MAESGGAGEAYVPPKRSGKLVALIAGLLVVTNIGTGLGVYYLAAPARTPETLNVIGPWTGSEMQLFLPVLDAFTNQTGIKVAYSNTRQEDLATTLPVQFAARRTPGDVIFMVSSFIKTNGPAGHIADVSDLISPANFNAPNAVDPVTGSDGKVYGGVYTGKVKPGFWYRQSFFSAHGLSPPTDWAGFRSLLNTIAAIPGITAPIASGDGKGWPLSDVTEHFIATYGGAGMHRNLTAGTVAWNSSAVRTVFADRLVPLLAAGDFGEPLQWDLTALQGWWNGQYALYFMGSWITGMVQTPSDLRVFSLPAVPGVSQGLVFGVDYFFIPKYTAKLAAARQLLQYLSGATGQTEQVKRGGHIATAKGVPDSAYPPGAAAVTSLLVGKEILPDLDDTKGEPFQSNFWSELKALWTSADPAGELDAILSSIESQA